MESILLESQCSYHLRNRLNYSFPMNLLLMYLDQLFFRKWGNIVQIKTLISRFDGAYLHGFLYP